MEVSPTPTQPLLVPVERIGSFVRQLSHDVRNGLNAIDLQATLVAELATDEETASEARKLRSMIGNVAQMLHQVSGIFSTLSLNSVDCPARELVEAVRERVEKKHPEDMKGIPFDCVASDAAVRVDFELFTRAVIEIFNNAFQFREPGGEITCAVRTEKGCLVLEIIEKKNAVPSDPARWGTEPLSSSRRGGLGLGLYYAHRIMEAHAGALEQSFAGGRLVTRLSLPLISHG
jgi:K+-sensing histidine kinase KdpD